MPAEPGALIREHKSAPSVSLKVVSLQKPGAGFPKTPTSFSPVIMQFSPLRRIYFELSVILTQQETEVWIKIPSSRSN